MGDTSKEVVSEEGAASGDSMETQVTECFDSGAIKQVANYLNGKLHGTVSQYREDGTLACESVFNDGSLHGSVKLYDEGGVVVRRTAKAERGRRRRRGRAGGPWRQRTLREAVGLEHALSATTLQRSATG